MRAFILITGAAIGLGSTTFQAEAACNARGEYCSYPGWAANAFSAPEDRVPESALDNPTNSTAFGYVAPGYTSAYGYVATGNTQNRYRRRYPR